MWYNFYMEKVISDETRTTEMVTISRAEYEAMKAQINWLMERLGLLKKKVYGSSSEQTREEEAGQLSFLFNEAEAYQPQEAPAQETTVAEHTRKKPNARVTERLPEDAPVEVVEHHLSEEERMCPECGTAMAVIGKDVRRSLKIIPAQVVIREDVYYTYGCPQCKVDGTDVPIVKAEKDPAVIPGSFASPEAIAYIMTQKFVMASPLYRLEQELARMNVPLSRQTMSNWILRSANDWLKPVYEELCRLLRMRHVLHADETTLQVLREAGKAAQTKSYMWLYRTGGDAEHPIVLYDYQPNRKAENAEKFLEGFAGYLHADGYQGYHKLPERIRVVGCWAHARRKFDEALNAVPKPDRAGSAAAEGVAYCDRLFAIEKELTALTPKERYEQRLKREKPVLDAFLAWAESKTAPPKSLLGKAIHYLREQWQYLIRYLEDGRLEISNNRAERSIKPFVIGRKNFLFANTPNGAQGSAIMYSMIETAKENGLDPYRYLVWLLSTAPALAAKDKAWAAKLIPAAAPMDCKVSS